MSDQNESRDNPTGDVPPVSNSPASGSRKGMGGPAFHKPGCKCNPCKARRRKEEAEFGPTGVRGLELVAAPPPPKGVTDRNGLKKAAPKDLRVRAAEYLQHSLAMPGATKADIARKMGIHPERLYKIITDATKAGIIQHHDPIERIDYEIIPKIVDNINYFLDAKDKTVTIEAAKGTIFKSYAESKGISDANQTVLALKIELPDSNSTPLLAGRIVGQPKLIVDDMIVDAEVENAPS